MKFWINFYKRFLEQFLCKINQKCTTKHDHLITYEGKTNIAKKSYITQGHFHFFWSNFHCWIRLLLGTLLNFDILGINGDSHDYFSVLITVFFSLPNQVINKICCFNEKCRFIRTFETQLCTIFSNGIFLPIDQHVYHWTRSSKLDSKGYRTISGETNLRWSKNTYVKLTYRGTFQAIVDWKKTRFMWILHFKD